ncbi:MAG: hypothetical protein H6713_28925 [Myxococcales bacterium]|nr:hypothetical protein [Myxococcales bacterium]MCB9753987.1 hypothetical protein [Myxococcales bacterium]
MAYSSNSARRRPLRLGLLALLLVSGCGPTVTEMGSAVLIALPIAHVITVGLITLLHRFWRREYPELRVEPIAHVVAVLVLIALAVSQPEAADNWRLISIALIVGGGATLAWSLLLWRLLLPLCRSWAAAIAPLVMSGVSAMMAYSVATLAFGKESAKECIFLWMIGSGYGWLPSIVVAALFLGASWRLARRVPLEPTTSEPGDA